MTERMQTTLPDGWLAIIAGHCHEQGVEQSAFVRQAIAKELPERLRKKLAESRRGRPAKRQPPGA